jgi:hypothetical protein
VDQEEEARQLITTAINTNTNTIIATTFFRAATLVRQQPPIEATRAVATSLVTFFASNISVFRISHQ